MCSRPQQGRFKAQSEFVVWGSKGQLEKVPGCFTGVFAHTVKPAERRHLISKPLALIKELLAITRPGVTMLAPFVGGGTTALAALELGRKMIASDVSSENAGIVRRLLEEKTKVQESVKTPGLEDR